jgi:hypothetical protein
MFVVRTIEGCAHSLGQLVGAKQAVSFHYPAFAMRTHLGSMGLSHGLFLGNRQLMILSPSPLLLTALLCSSIHRLTTSWLACASLRCPRSKPKPSCLPLEAFGSTTKESGWLSRSPGGRPRSAATPPQTPAKTTHNRRWPWGRDRLFGDRLLHQTQGFSGITPAVEGRPR